MLFSLLNLVCGAFNCLITDPVTHFLIECIKFNEPRHKYLKTFFTESRKDISVEDILKLDTMKK